jgi:MFS family permease
LAQEDNLERFVERNLPWNFIVNLLDVSFYTLGANFVARQTIMPLLLSQLTTSKLAIGLIPALDSLGFLLPQLLMANYTQGLRRKLPFIVAVSSFGERGPYLVIGLVVWWLARSAPGFAAAALLALLAVASFSAGVTTPAWYDMIAKAIPVRRRGIWSGLAFGIGALMGIAGAAVAGTILVNWQFPHNYALCFLAGFGVLMISWVALVLNREPDSPSIRTGTSLRDYLKQLPAIMRRDENYLHFLVARGVTSLASMATGFYAVYASQRWGMSGEEVAILTAILTGSQAIMNVTWGLIGDHAGHKVVLCGGSIAIALAAAVGWAAPAPVWMWATFALLGTGVAAGTVSNLNIILEFCAAEERPTYIGLTNTLLAPVAAFAPLLGGGLATLAGYRSMFVVAGVCGIVAAALMAFWVREPRHGAVPVPQA